MKRFMLGGVLCLGIASLSVAQYRVEFQPPGGSAQPPGGGFGGGPPGGGFGGGPPGGGFGGGGPGFGGGQGGGGFGGRGGGMGGPGFGGGGGGRGGGMGGPGGGMGGRGFDSGMMFDRMAGGKPAIDVNTYSSPFGDPTASQKMRDFMTKKGNSSGQMTKELFAEYMNEQMAARRMAGGGGGPGGGFGGGGPGGGFGGGAPGGGFAGGPGGFAGGRPGMAPGMGAFPGALPQPMVNPEELAKERFKQFDKSDDGVLQAEELPEALKAELLKFDKDGNGSIELEEYIAFYKVKFASSMDHEAHPPFEDDLEKRPTIFRAGKLPKDLPSWFETLDKDKDGQVGLYEWKTDSSRTSDEFRALDFNGDGFITIDECLRNNRILAKKAGIPTGGGNDSPLPGVGMMDKKEAGGNMSNRKGGGGDRPKGWGNREEGGGGGGRRDKGGDRPKKERSSL